MNQPSPLYKRNKTIVERRLDDEVLLVNSETDAIFHLNPLGAGIWNMLQNPTSKEEIVQTLLMAFPENDSDKIEEDVNKLFNEMKNRELISMVND